MLLTPNHVPFGPSSRWHMPSRAASSALVVWSQCRANTAVKEIHKRCVFWPTVCYLVILRSATVISPIDINPPRTLYRCQAKLTHLIGVEGTRGLTDLNAIVLWSRVTVCQCAFCDSSTARRPHRTVAMIQAQMRLDHQISTERSSTKHRRVNRIRTWENILRKAVRFREWAY